MIKNPVNNKTPKTPLKKVTEIFGYVLLGTAFLFSFCLISKEVRDKQWIAWTVLGSVLVAEIIAFIITYFVVKKKTMTQNDKDIKQAIKLVKEGKDQIKLDDSSNEESVKDGENHANNN